MAADEGAEGAYPAHWEADVVLRDGSTMHIRPIRAQDSDALQAFHTGQSAQSIYFRFFAPMERLSEKDLERFTQVDHVDRVALVLVQGLDEGERIVAVGRFDRWEPGGEEAEVAFNVSDQAQGKGLGSILLEHLAAAGRELGIRRFTADVLPTNTKMLRVFTDAGYDATQTLADGVIEVSVPIRPTDRSLAVLAEREQRAESLSMAALLGASAVLVHAAGEEGEALAQRVGENIAASGFSGEVLSTGTGAQVEAMPELPSLAVVAAPPGEVIALLPLFAARGVRAVVLLSGGFSSAPGAGLTSQRALVRALRDHGLRLVGPRSFGVVAHGATGRLDATLGPDRLYEGDVGLFCQSTAAARALLDQASQRGLGLSTFLAAGHRVDISGNDTMQYWTTDERTKVACLVLESIGNPRKFSRVARRLASSRPVIVTISGTTGQQRLPSHPVRTSSAPPSVLSQMLEQAGVLLAGSVRQQLDWAMLLAAQPLPHGDRVAIVTNASSQAVVLEELLAQHQLEVSRAWTLAPTASAETIAEALSVAQASEDWDALIIGYGAFGVDHTGPVARMIAELGARSTRPVLTLIPGLAGLDPRLAHEDSQVPAFAETVDLAGALGAARRHARRLGRPGGVRLDPTDLRRREAKKLVQAELVGVPRTTSVRLDPERTAELLATYGLDVWPATRVGDLDSALSAAAAIGGPVALKATDDLLRHRTDLGGVRLDLSTPEELAEAFRSVTARLESLGHRHPVLEVQQMAPTGPAAVIRAVEDELYGPIVSFGLAGDASELLEDVAYRIPPLTDHDVAALIRDVRASARLLGYRGLPPVDLAALEDVVARVALLKEELAEISAVALNPVMVTETGLSILSATIDLAQPGRGDIARRALP